MAQLEEEIKSYTQPIDSLARELKPLSVFEIGIGYQAYSTKIWLKHGCSLVTVDRADWGENVEGLKKRYPKFTFIKGETQDVLPQAKKQYDLVYVDGDHAYEGAKFDIEHCKRLVKPGGYIVLDDYGVDFGAVDIRGNGETITGDFGVKKAADETLQGWKEYVPELPLANGGKVFICPSDSI